MENETERLSSAEENIGANDRLLPKPEPPNKLPQQDETLQQKLEEVKKNPTSKPWETIQDRLDNSEASNSNFC